MKRLLLMWCFCWLLVTPLLADKKPPFHKGHVVLYTGDTLQCSLRFTRKVQEGLLEIVTDKTAQMLTVKQVSEFSYFDEKRQTERIFYNVSLKPELSSRSHEVFVELKHSNDELAIITHRTIGYSKKWQINPFRKKEVTENYYLLEKHSRMVLPLSKESMLAMMKDDKKTIEAFLETSSIKFRQVSDFITVLDYQQSLR
jgi:hypothetical protein